jgi:uncharacterized protein YcfJ
MNVAEHHQKPHRRLVGAAIGFVMGATIGIVVGLLCVEERDAQIFLAVIGAFFGGVLGANVLTTVGWCMIAGALVGGFAAMWLTRVGKAAMYGVPPGAVVGMTVGRVIEATHRKRHTTTEQIEEV